MRSAAIPVFLMLMVVAAGWYLYPLVRMQYVEQQEVARLEAELVDIRARNTEMSEQVERLNTPAGVEEAARESLGLVKPGESVYMVAKGDESVSATQTAPMAVVSESPDIWQSILDFVFGVQR